MDLAGLRHRFEQLSKQKATIEASIAQLTKILDQNGVGLHDPLVDSEDFPRSDIDVVAVRRTRHDISRLNYDHKTVMNELELLIPKLHSMNVVGSHPDGTNSMQVDSHDDAKTRDDDESIQFRPFLQIDSLAPESAADIAGIKIGDSIIEFGSITCDNFSQLQDVAELCRNTRPGDTIRIRLLRSSQSNPVTVSLVKPPNQLPLGLHMVPI